MIIFFHGSLAIWLPLDDVPAVAGIESGINLNELVWHASGILGLDNGTLEFSVDESPSR